MLTIFTPFERTESSSLETNENRSLATKVGSFDLSMDGSETDVDGAVAPVESNGRVARDYRTITALSLGLCPRDRDSYQR